MANVFPGGSFDALAQALDAALVSLLGLELQDVEQQRQRRLLLRLDEPRHQFAGGGGEGEAA